MAPASHGGLAAPRGRLMSRRVSSGAGRDPPRRAATALQDPPRRPNMTIIVVIVTTRARDSTACTVAGSGARALAKLTRPCGLTKLHWTLSTFSTPARALSLSLYIYICRCIHPLHALCHGGWLRGT